MLNANISAADTTVGEYLIYRGFTQSFQCLENEKQRDRTKRFEVSRVVETIFQNLIGYEIDSFILLWDFLTKRFFIHLDGEHLILCGHLKSDLIKFYLVNCCKNRNKEKIFEFFASYSHEILSESSPLTSGNLRHWYTLPYVEEPEKDNEFVVYFSPRWMELLRITLHNFLTVVFAASTPPKLLLLEKWFRTENQVEMRLQLKLLNDKMEMVLSRFDKYEERLTNLRETVRILTSFIQNNIYKSNSNNNHGLNSMPKSGSSSNLFDAEDDHGNNSSSSSHHHSHGHGHSSTQHHENRRSKEIEQYVSKLAADCARKTAILGNLPKEERQKEILGEIYHLNPNAVRNGMHDINDYYGGNTGTSGSSYHSGGTYITATKELEELEGELVQKVSDWLAILKLEH